MTYKFNRADGNQKEVVNDLREMGYSVRLTHMVKSVFPDTVIGWNGHSLLVEIKRPREKLTPDEQEFFKTWKGSAIVGTSAEQIHSEFMKRYYPK